MVTNHYGDGIQPSVEAMVVIDDFGKQWTLVPDTDYFGRWNTKPAIAAMEFERSGEVH